MNLPIIFSIIASTTFGLVAIFYSMREEKAKREILEREKKNRQRMSEISVLHEIQNRMSYSLDIEKITEVIMGSLRSIIPYSTASALLIQREQIDLKTYAEEAVNAAYHTEVKKHMLESLKCLLGEAVPVSVHEMLSGTPQAQTNTGTVGSIFHIPLVVNNNVVGLITVSSLKQNLYSEEEMAIIYRITNQATAALGKLETLLQNEKEKLMAMISSLKDGVFMVDTSSKLLVINEAAKQLLLIKQLDVTINDILRGLPMSSDMGKKIHQAIQEKHSVQVTDITLGDKICNAIIQPVFSSQSLNLLVDSQKEIIGASILLQDITLEKSVSKMKEDFTNIMVHELRSPLTAIKAASQLIMLQDEKLQGPERQKLLNLVFTQSAKLLDEVALILDSAKIESGMLTVAKVPGDMKKLIEEKVSFFQPEAQNKHIMLSSDLDTTHTMAMIDQRYIGQVVNNLLSNALKFTPVGGSITMRSKLQDGKLVVSCTDTGLGIPKDKQRLLFQKFSQIRTPNAQVGTGLGLYMVKGVVEAHGGSVGLESEPGAGTTFWFTVPLATEQSALHQPGTQSLTQPPVAPHAVPPTPQTSLHPLPMIHPEQELVPIAVVPSHPSSVMMN